MAELGQGLIELAQNNAKIYSKKCELVDVLKSKGASLTYTSPMSDIISTVSGIGGKATNEMLFVTSKEIVRIGVSGDGTVSLFCDGNLCHEVELTKDVKYYEIVPETSGEHTYTFVNSDNIRELYICDNEISSLEFNEDIHLNKLVAYNNNISSLSCDHLVDLQFLHIFNNPICDSSEYEVMLTSCVDSLPNRTGMSIGSIVTYPWYGLETLICNDNGIYRKYPIGTYSHYDGSTKNNMNNDKTVSIVDDKLYGVVEGNSIVYYTGRNSELVAHDIMNRHHTLRKTLEKYCTLRKNWMFGSAIQYRDDYKHCYHYFRDIGVQDVWETAEKGFGICIGSIDNYNGRVSDWDDMNIKAFLDINGDETSPSGDESEHGDKILSHIAGRGGLSPYGICPNASFLVMGPLSVNDNAMKLLTMPGNCDSLTFSYGYTENSDKCARRYYLGEFGKNGIITESAGNDGDGLPWTMDASYKMSGFGDFGDSETDTQLLYHTNTLFVGSLDPLRCPSVFSCNSTESNNTTYGTGLTTEDYISHYGEQIACYKLQEGGLSYTQGTSMASPNCCATLALMRIIYSKMNEECECFGKYSKFMDYVKDNWMDPISGSMSFAVGLGIPCFNSEPRTMNLESVPPAQFSYPEVVKVGEPFSVQGIVSDGCKAKLTYNHSFRNFAQLGDKLVPLRANVSQFEAYTNTALKNPVDYAANYKSEMISGITQVDDDLNLTMSAPDFIAENTLVNVDEVDYVSFNYDSNNFTIHIPIKFDYDHIAIGSPAEGSSTKSLIFLKHYDGTTAMSIFAIVKVKIEDGNRISVPNTYEYKDGSNTKTRINGMLYKFHSGNGSAYAGYAERLGISEGDLFVLTLTFDSERGTSIYFNGNLLALVVPCDDCAAKASNLLVPKEILINDSIDDVVYYNKVLSHEEVINNTIVLLKNLEAE